MTKRKIVETAETEASSEEATEDAPVVTEVPKSDLKSKVAALIEEAPNLSEVQKNAWLYTEWLARLNGAVLNS